MVMKNNIQRTVQTKFDTKQMPYESARKCELQISFSQNTMPRRFFGEIFVQYDFYEITEND